MSEEQGERVHQDIKDMEKRYQGVEYQHDDFTENNKMHHIGEKARQETLQREGH